MVRNLLIDAEHKITELDGIQQSLGRLVDPVSKTLRAFEEAKNEKLSLQSVLNNTRIAYSKLREDLATAERKAATLDTECIRLREVLTVAQQSVQALEATKAEQSAELTARRAQIAELQRTGAAAGHRSAAHPRREPARARAGVTLAEKQDGAARGRRRRRHAEVPCWPSRSAPRCRACSTRRSTTRRSCRAACSTWTSRFTATQARLQKVETALAEAQSERIRLGDRARGRDRDAPQGRASRRTARFEALQARSLLSDKLLDESRQTLAARADEIGAFDRRLAEATMSRGAIETKFGQIETALAERDAQIKELERGARRARRAQRRTDPRGRARARAPTTARRRRSRRRTNWSRCWKARSGRPAKPPSCRSRSSRRSLQREQLDRTMAEGALEAGRKDIARLLREISAMQYRPDGTLEPRPTRRSRTPPEPQRRHQQQTAAAILRRRFCFAVRTQGSARRAVALLQHDPAALGQHDQRLPHRPLALLHPDQAVADGVVPDRQARTRGAPGIHRVAVGARLLGHPVEELHGQIAGGIVQ